ncbi:MAG TPA: efflux RND transporter periplasmic adaptor subunit [Vicinamibacteria bacterium]|jgi:HlyD family secretion protein|nr:efflux RND transporter periplasmic adaptor subunit [Vicinamibacteria bacterium]
MASKRTRILAAAGMVLVLGGVVGFSVARDNRSKVPVQTQKVERRDLVSIVSASGEVRPKRYVNIGANPSGRIIQLTVKEGDMVKKGQVLARIESTRFEAETRQSEAAVLSARADLDRALADVDVAQLAFDRTKKMFADKLVSDQVMDQALADLKMKTANAESLRKRIAQLQAQLDSIRDDLDKTTVICPMDGMVTSLPKEEGEVVIGAQSFSPTVIMTVADLSVMESEIMVDETDIRNVKLGQSAEVRVDALEGIKIKGEVTEIGASAIPRGSTTATSQGAAGVSTGNQAKDFKVTVTLKDPPSSLRPGLNATADITTARKERVLAVPIQSVVVRELNKEGKIADPAEPPAEGGNAAVLVTKPQKGEEKDGVFVVTKDGKVAFRPVKTGIIGDTDIEIVGGVTEGEEIVSGSYKTLRTLKDQARVKVEVPKKS